MTASLLSEFYAGFEAEDPMLDSALGCTPLLWLAMFRPADVRDGSDMGAFGRPVGGRVVTAPIVSRRQALANRYTSGPVLHRALGSSGCRAG